LKMQAADGRRQATGARVLFSCILLSAVCLLSSRAARAQIADYEHRPVTAVEVVLEATPADASAQAEFQSLVRIKAGGEYTAVAARQSLQDLFASDRVANARIEITETQPGASGSPIRVRFIVQRQLVIAGVSVRVGDTLGVPVATDEIRARLNLLEPGRRLSLASIEKNADEIQTYLRERGYYDAKVEHTEEPESHRRDRNATARYLFSDARHADTRERDRYFERPGY
jgi:outer membrane protein assembly factor BamA